MDFQHSVEQQGLAWFCKEFAEKQIIPFQQQLEDDLSLRQTLFTKMAQAGLFLLTVPHTVGGTFRDTISYLLALKEIAKADAGISVAMAVTNMVAEMIYLYGTEQQQNKYLPRISSGKNVPFSFALTERHAGSDAKSIRTFAKRVGEVYIINGEKQFITNADIAGAILLFARTNDDEEHPNITAFMIDQDTPGLTVTKKERKLGLLSANLVDLKLDQCHVIALNRIGQEGEGLKIAFKALDSGRLGIAAQAIGIGDAAFEAAAKYSKEREQFGNPISEYQAIAFKLADMHVKLSASRLLVEKAAWLKDEGRPFTLEAAEAKLFCTERCNEIASEAVQIFGGYGYVKDYPVERYFRDARVTTLYEGTSEIQRLIISRAILKAI